MSHTELCRRLAAFDTPTIANVIELFDVVPRSSGYMDRRIRAAFPQLSPMVGFAATAAFRADTPPPGTVSYASLDDQIAAFAELPGPAVVVIQDYDDPPVAAVFGEIMCTLYQAFGSEGLVTSGAGRDLLQVEALGYPVFTDGTICSHGYCRLMHLGQAVRVGGLMVNQGDLLHGDANGVLLVPLAIAEAVAELAPDFVAAERILLDYLQGPEAKTTTAWAARRKEFGQAIGGLEARAKQAPRA